MRRLTIRWQRLIDDRGDTCPRCRETGDAVESVSSQLQKALSELGFTVELIRKELPLSAFEKDPLESNRIWINEKPLEEWIGAEAGESRCCDACGDNDCRTISVGNETFESIPEAVILRAALLAAAELLK